MTPAERVVVEAAVRWAASRTIGSLDPLQDAVDALLVERQGPQPETVEITWAQVVEGDHLYRAPGGGPGVIGQAGQWMEVVSAAPIGNGVQRKIHVKGLGRPIQPVSAKPVTVQRGATGKALDMFGAVLWSGPTAAER